MKKLDKITMYGHEWLVVTTDGGTATLWMTELFAAHIFNEDNNDYETSSLRKWLKKQESAFNFGSEVLSVNGDKLFIPSKEEVEDDGEWGLTYKERAFNNLKYSSYVWLRSPVSDYTDCAWEVNSSGDVGSYGVTYAQGVRPCIKVEVTK